ncbi:uncharacterized protein LOC143259440 isoform X7 [Megalopta genalis]|uniref:uncharacterized protein LOC143259440 isoform X7 n=1 Tax=Megalopta genalis TaxID=115081 RepID=UPI003FD61743
MHARVMWKLPSSLWRERGRRLSVRWITGAELGRRISSSHWWREKRPSWTMVKDVSEKREEIGGLDSA